MPHILVVENSATARYLMVKQVQALGHEVFTAGSVSEGLDALNGTQSFAGCVLSWPLGTDPGSQELLSLLQLSTKQIPAVLLFHPRDDSSLPDWTKAHPRILTHTRDKQPDALGEFQQLVADKPSLQAARPTSVEAVEVEKKAVRILFVDDSPSVRTAYKRLLEKNGYEVETAYNVADGYEKAQQRVYHLAIIDYFMPDANGDALCRKLRENPQTAGMMSAVLTSSYLEQVINDSLTSGAVECMFKSEPQNLFLARVAAMARAVDVQMSSEAERQRLAGILASVGDGVYGVNNDGVITFVNPATLNMLGYESETDMVGKPAAELLHHALVEDEKDPLAEAYGTGAEFHSQETVFQTHGNDTMPIEFTLLPLWVQGRQEGSVVAFRDISERRTLEDLRWQMEHDVLTGLWNRSYFEQALTEHAESLRQLGGKSALLRINLDQFSQANQRMGRDAGDALLAAVANRIRTQAKEGDVVARLQGDEYAVLLKHLGAQDLYELAEAFRETIAEAEFDHEGDSGQLEASVGVVMIDGSLTASGKMLQQASEACREAKRQGRNRVVNYEPEETMPLEVVHA